MARPTRTDAPPSAQWVGPTTETPMLPTTRARATAILAALSLSALLVLPSVALADATLPADTDDADTTDTRPSQLPTAAAPRAVAATSQRPGGSPADDNGTDGSTGDGSTGDGTSDGTSEDGRAEPPADDGTREGSGAAPADEDDTTPLPTPVREGRLISACAPHLVTFTRDGINGDDTAVALTSQAMDAAQPGWLHVSWEAATGTELDAVEVLHVDGTRSVLGAATTGTVHDVLAVTFCGRVDDIAGSRDASDTAGQDAGANVDAEVAITGAPRTGQVAGDAGDIPVPPPATTVGNASAPSGNTASPAATATDNPATASDEAESEAEAEVLGVQIVAPERDAAPEASDDQDVPDDETDAELSAAPILAGTSSGSGGMHPLLLAAAIAAGLAGAVTVLRGRSSATTSSTSQGNPL